MSDTLPGFLEFAVPLEMQRMGHLDDETLGRIARRESATVAARGDIMQFRASGTGKAAAALIRGLAAAALVAEGGITFAGKHWCRDHARCEAAS